MGSPKRLPQPESYAALQDLSGPGVGHGGFHDVSSVLEMINQRLVAIEKLQQDQVDLQAGNGIQKILEDHTERMLQAWVEVLAGGHAAASGGQASHALKSPRSPRLLVSGEGSPLILDSGRSPKAGASGKAEASYEATLAKADKIQQDLQLALKKEKENKKVQSLARLSTSGSTRQKPSYLYIARAIVLHPVFEAISSVLIVLNAAVIGAEVDFGISHPLEQQHLFFRIVNIFFVVAFFCELVLRMLAAGMYFISRQNPSIYWNLFDTTLVICSIVEEGLSAVSNINVNALRLLRTLRLVRSFRIVRVFKAFRDLRVMLAGILQSLRSLVWAGLLLLAIMYLVAVCLLQFAGEEMSLQELDPSQAALDKVTFGELMNHYGSLTLTIYTLYKSIAGGIDWGDACAPLLALSYPIGCIFLAYVSFAILCVLNIITGVFVENANRLTVQDEEMVLMEQMEMRKKWFSEVEATFKEADSTGSGTIDKDEFREQMENVRLQTCLRKIGIQAESFTSDGLFTLLDFDGDGHIDLDEFVQALSNCHGTARAVDVAKINRDTRMLRREMRQVLKALKIT